MTVQVRDNKNNVWKNMKLPRLDLVSFQLFPPLPRKVAKLKRKQSTYHTNSLNAGGLADPARQGGYAIDMPSKTADLVDYSFNIVFRGCKIQYSDVLSYFLRQLSTQIRHKAISDSFSCDSTYASLEIIIFWRVGDVTRDQKHDNQLLI